MAVQIGDYVNASFDFSSDEVSDLSLSCGDLVRITSILDKNWASGEKIGLNRESGNFPLAYIEHAMIPSTRAGQIIFLALEHFPAEQNEDLEIKKGDIIVGLEAVDDMWWKGQNGSQTGIFPLSFVVKLDINNGHQSSSYSEQCLQSSPDDVKSGTKSGTHDVGGHNIKERAEDIESGTKPGTHDVGGHNIKEVAYARALMDVIPQLDGELAFCEGDVIEITESVDCDWVYGQIGSKKGLVFAACVQLLNNGSQFKSNNYLNQNIKLNRDKGYHEVLSTYAFKHDVDSLKLENSENRLINSSSQFHTLTNVDNAKAVPGGLMKQTVTSPNPSELSLKKNSIVFVSRHMVADRTEGEGDGKKGQIPAKCDEFIVDCQPAHSPDLSESPSSARSSIEAYNSKHHDTVTEMNATTTSCPFSIDNHTDMYISECSRASINQSSLCPEADLHEYAGNIESKGTGSIYVISSDPIENISNHGSQNQVKNNGIRTNSYAFKPPLPLKPAISHKPSLPPKPSLSTKPSLPPPLTPKPFPVMKPSAGINPRFLKTMKPADSSKQISKENIPATKEINSKPLRTLKPVDSSQQITKDRAPIARDNTPKPSSVIHYYGDRITRSITTDNIESKCTFTKQQTGDTLNLSLRNYKGVNRNSCSDLVEGTVSDIDMNTCSVSFRPAARVVPQNPAVISPGLIAEASSVNNPGPSPQVFSNRATASSESMPAVQRVPRRKRAEGERNKARVMRRSTQTATSFKSRSPPRLSVRPTSFPSAPRRPPPRPASYVLSSPHGQGTEEDHSLIDVMNLKEKLKAVTDGIEKYEQTRADLEKSAGQDDSQEEQTETKSTLDFLEKQLIVLQQEKSRLEENLLAANSEDAKLEKSRLLAAQHAVDEEKRREEAEIRKEEERKKKAKRKIHREKVIEEIINTERDYLMCLQLCLETFYDGQEPPPGLDLDFLLGNMEEIAEVSQKILLSLESCVSGKSVEEQCIGQCFIRFAEDMKNTYAPYCRNHDEVITALEQYGDSTSISSYLSSKIDKIKEQTNVFDMASILIRPVQRILKYPLLLIELLKNTEEDHPDRNDIETAIKAMTDVARAINEYKRRKDLVYKYKTSTDESFSDKISKLNLHSIKKKSTRMRGRLSTNFGIALQMKDEMFDKEEAKFRNLEKAVKVFLESVEQYLQQSQETMRCQTVYVDDIMDFYKGRECAEATKLYEVTCKQLSLYDSMKETVDNVVVVPLNILVGLFSAPTKVIEKRFDKLLDYNYQLGKMENDKELQTAKNDYEAMNAQLLDELPKFYNLAFRMLRHCISAFVLARRDFMDQSLKETCSLLELPSIASKANLMEVFKIRHTTAFDHISMLSFIPKGFNPRVDTVKADRAIQKGRPSTDGNLQQQISRQSSSGGFQNEAQRRYLHQLYPPDKLYTVSSTYNATDLMDISLTEGTLVAVVKQLDPMGNTERWFVDDGGSKGFVPSSILQPLEYSPLGSIANADEDDDIISILSGDSGDNMIFTGNDERVDCHTNNSFTDSQKSEPPQYQYYYALYDFKPRHPNETSLTAGHPVTVLTFHDLDGNSEWWFVDSEGKRGYVPANYMAPVSYS